MNEAATAPAIDKSTWGDGEWQHEPDRVDWVAHGLACLALRHPRHGSWCGYVGVPPEHPLYGVDRREPEISALDTHGGINYSAVCDGEICHQPADGMPDDVWWFGFDCMHLLDLSPGTDARERAMGLHLSHPMPSSMRETYRALPYVREQVDQLAAQLDAMK